MDVKNTKNRRNDPIIIDKERYKNLLSMMTSSKEDVNVALECINALDIKANLIPVLLLRKHSDTDISSWKKLCSKHIKYQKSLGVEDDAKSISYSEIYNAMKKVKATEEHVEIFLEDLSQFFRKHAIKFDFIENLEINVKIK